MSIERRIEEKFEISPETHAWKVRRVVILSFGASVSDSFWRRDVSVARFWKFDASF
jgi:hypothetical protein